MEELYSLIFKRRSVRAYTEQPVEKEKIEKLLKAAMSAPSACNTQPWEFVVIQNSEVLAEIREAFPMARYNAPCAITVCSNTNLCRRTKQLWIQDCSAAMENMLLAATALGLGSVWIGVEGVELCDEKLSGIIKLPEHVKPLGIAYIGYAAETKEPRTQYDEKRVYFETYGNK